MVEDAPEEIDGIIPIPCISLKEGVEKIGAMAQTVDNFPAPKRSLRNSLNP
jgi:hypothetical protein